MAASERKKSSNPTCHCQQHSTESSNKHARDSTNFRTKIFSKMRSQTPRRETWVPCACGLRHTHIPLHRPHSLPTLQCPVAHVPGTPLPCPCSIPLRVPPPRGLRSLLATVSPAAADPKGCSLAFPGVTGDSLLALRPSTSFSAAACQCGVQPARPRSASSVPVPLLHLPCPCAPSPRPPLSTHAARSLARTRARFAQVRVERRRHSISD